MQGPAEGGAEAVEYSRESPCVTLGVREAVRLLSGRRIATTGDSLVRVLSQVFSDAFREQLLSEQCANGQAVSLESLRILKTNEGWVTGQQPAVGRDVTVPNSWTKLVYKAVGVIRHKDVQKERQQTLMRDRGVQYFIGSVTCMQLEALQAIEAKPWPLPEVLVASLGAWYNLPPTECHANVGHCSRASVDRVLGVLRATPRAGDAEADGRALLEAFDKGEERCRPVSRQSADAFARELVELLLALHGLRRRGVRHMFWLQTLPQHFPPFGTYAYPSKLDTPCQALDPERSVTTWRDEIASEILPRVAPFLEKLHTFELMKDREGDHVKVERLDCQHFCYESPSHQELASMVLTAIVRRLATSEGRLQLYAREPTSAEQRRCEAWLFWANEFFEWGWAVWWYAMICFALLVAFAVGVLVHLYSRFRRRSRVPA